MQTYIWNELSDTVGYQRGLSKNIKLTKIRVYGFVVTFGIYGRSSHPKYPRQRVRWPRIQLGVVEFLQYIEGFAKVVIQGGK
jgi:hypothetical protein